QANRPATGVVTDKGVPQSDSFAKYAAAFFNMSRSSVTGLAPIFPDTFYRFTHYWFAAADIPVANDIPVHCADA
ncbi:hypothetical protein, partial [Klebsiella michiganensis]|uniref:hypothetical protein n=1 Tax=Klebsiella michiganensis TaxID=1134687 RepID=UPI001C49AAB1